MKDIKMILASASPRRVEILKSHGITPIVMPANIDESFPDGLSAYDAVMYIAKQKGEHIESSIDKTKYKGYFLLAADTIVYNEKMIGKPKDRADAFDILWSLKNKAHYVISGVYLSKIGENLKHSFYVETKVHTKGYSKEDINAYLDTGESFDKAGAYAIQGVFKKHIDHIEGDLENVIGLPWEAIKKELI